MKIGTQAVDGWAFTFGTPRRGLGGAVACPPMLLLAVPNVTDHQSTVSVRITAEVRFSAILMYQLKQWRI